MQARVVAATLGDREYLDAGDDGTEVSRPLMADRDVALSIAAVERVLVRLPGDTDSDEEAEFEELREKQLEQLRRNKQVCVVEAGEGDNSASVSR